jgi:hypothetical protein
MTERKKARIGAGEGEFADLLLGFASRQFARHSP